MESYLLQHYIEKTSYVLLNVDGLTNNLRTLVLPRVIGSSMLTNAIYATSSQHVYFYSDNPEYHTEALTYYGKAAAALQHSIASFESSSAIADQETALLTSVFLCKYEIISGGLKLWRSHLRGLQKMLSYFRSHESRVSPDVASFVQSL